MYAILRTEKMKTGGKISVSLEHNNRERECLASDPNLEPKNEYIKTTNWEELQNETEQYMTRKDNVRVVEFVMTASPDFFQNANEEKIQNWKNENIKFLSEMFGEDNIKNLVLHRDERTPHMHAHIVPLKDGKLNCKHYIGGKEKLRQLQDNYAKIMSRFGLQRGIEGSKAKHERVQAYYARANTPAPPTVQLEKPNRFGNLDTYTQENQSKIDEVNRIAQAKTQELERQKNFIESQKKALTKLEKQYKHIEQEKARLADERKNIEVERKKNIDFEVRKAVEGAKKEIDRQTVALEKEKASIADREAKISKMTIDAVKRYLDIDTMTNRKIIEAAKDLTKNDHTKNIYACLNTKNKGDIKATINDLEKLGCSPQKIKEVVAHSGLELNISKTNTISRDRGIR